LSYKLHQNVEKTTDETFGFPNHHIFERNMKLGKNRFTVYFRYYNQNVARLPITPYQSELAVGLEPTHQKGYYSTRTELLSEVYVSDKQDSNLRQIALVESFGNFPKPSNQVEQNVFILISVKISAMVLYRNTQLDLFDILIFLKVLEKLFSILIDKMCNYLNLIFRVFVW
jgi:hypothetical protein